MSKYKLTIERDDNPENPREWDTHLGTMACKHSRYNLGDEGASIDDIPEDDDDAIILPLYLYDHSGITMSTKPFSCSWDSGQVGYIYCTIEQAIEMLGDRDVTVERITECLKKEVEVYDTYLRGDVYRYVIEEGTGCDCCGNVQWEVVDSCCGFFGYDHKDSGLIESIEGWLPEEAYSIIDKAIDSFEPVYYDTDLTVTVEKNA
jgi:hypothetical protein